MTNPWEISDEEIDAALKTATELAKKDVEQAARGVPHLHYSCPCCGYETMLELKSFFFEVSGRKFLWRYKVLHFVAWMLGTKR